MFTFLAFVLTILGCINWLMIGLLQYDFVAGMFGYQASIFSRLVYILIGIGASYFVIRILVNKGTVKIWEKKKKKQKEQDKQNVVQQTPAAATIPEQNPVQQNVEAGKDFQEVNFENLREFRKNPQQTPQKSENFEKKVHFSENSPQNQQDSLFDEFTKNQH